MDIDMSKYDPLGEYLKRQRGDLVPMTFAEIEQITGKKLPASSRYRAWWSNNDFNSVLTKVWIDSRKYSSGNGAMHIRWAERNIRLAFWSGRNNKIRPSSAA